MGLDKTYRDIHTKLDRILALLEPDATNATSTEPWAGYDSLNVAETLDMLKSMDKPARAKALAYERANKNRSSVVDVLAR